MNTFTEYDHYYTVCSWCDKEKNITEGLLAIEDVKEYSAQEKGLTSHIRKWIVYIICEPCMTGVEEAIHNKKPL